MRRLSQKVEQQVQHFESMQKQEGSPTKVDETSVLTHEVGSVARNMSRPTSCDSLKMPEIDYSVEVPPEIWAEERRGRLCTNGRTYEHEQRRKKREHVPITRLQESTGSENDQAMSNQTAIFQPPIHEGSPSNDSSKSENLMRSPLISKHHCLLMGHMFERIRLSKLLPHHRLCGLPPPSRSTPHDWKDLKLPCDLCEDLIKHNLYQCQVKACEREVCGGCKNRLEEERRQSARQSWK
jgi:hypothetical protein